MRTQSAYGPVVVESVKPATTVSTASAKAIGAMAPDSTAVAILATVSTAPKDKVMSRVGVACMTLDLVRRSIIHIMCTTRSLISVAWVRDWAVWSRIRVGGGDGGRDFMFCHITLLNQATSSEYAVEPGNIRHPSSDSQAASAHVLSVLRSHVPPIAPASPRPTVPLLISGELPLPVVPLLFHIPSTPPSSLQLSLSCGSQAHFTLHLVPTYIHFP